ncbi:MAG: carbamoyl-phosphate synthase large subunit [Bifidobacteriaceae bacterium]|jgi:carbamoyl-phosphate synthase large subunit|nr:carbamoyl-phosphate synthase large subunit [Bifidobacteriaceae bacterium]
MPLDKSIKSVLVIGSGPIVIGQAAEFDYSGTQSLKVLKENNIRTILINSNPATIMTDPEFADATYIEPITPEFVAKIIEKEKPDAILATMGGQTALNTALSLHDNGTLAKTNTKLIGANIEAINKGEDREIFKEVVTKCGGENARSFIAGSLEEAVNIVETPISEGGLGGYPVIIRPSFTMGGLGSGAAENRQELEAIASQGLHFSPVNTVLLEESLTGWKEFELELMRDNADTVVVVCSIENVDPVGVHTGDSITVAPQMTLTDVEYQNLRDLSIRIIREVGVEAGGCNIQFAINPNDGRIVVIEMNPRVSRSSALASKATGFPIAKISTMLAIGYRLDEIKNDITKTTYAAFEPTLDYVAVKIPKFNFEKFIDVDDTLTTTMKSVGEVMAFGGNFNEAFMKAIRSLDENSSVFGHYGDISRPNPNRIYNLLEYLLENLSDENIVDDLYEKTKIDKWFLRNFMTICDLYKNINTDLSQLKSLKQNGFSDYLIASKLENTSEDDIYKLRHDNNIVPTFYTVDTCAAEFESATPYIYSTYIRGEHYKIGGSSEESKTQYKNKGVIILGSGPNRIGQGIEFDYSCVHAALTINELTDKNLDSIMINCNPETVSTDYDTSSRLYFEPVTFETVREIIEYEEDIYGAITTLGGQTPLSLSARLKNYGVTILGTDPDAIDAAEDRELFSKVLEKTELLSPPSGTAINFEQAESIAHKIGFPVLIRPSFVLGGANMEIVYNTSQLEYYVQTAIREASARANLRQGNSAGSLPAPLLIDKFLSDAIEIDVDAIYDGENIFIGGIMEHIEKAGIHSGDSACVIPTINFSDEIIEEVNIATEKLAKEINVNGLINIQFALNQKSGIHSQKLFVIEANPRASRTVPFVSKATGVPLAKIATRVMLGEKLSSILPANYLGTSIEYHNLKTKKTYAVKEAVLPFGRFVTTKGTVVDSILSPQMRSTGEAMGLDKSYAAAFAKAEIGAIGEFPTKGNALITVGDSDKKIAADLSVKLEKLGWNLYATTGTSAVMNQHGLNPKTYNQQELTGLIESGEINLIVNTPDNFSTDLEQDDSKKSAIQDQDASKKSAIAGYEIRSLAIIHDIALYTTMREFEAAIDAIEILQNSDLGVMSLQENV